MLNHFLKRKKTSNTDLGSVSSNQTITRPHTTPHTTLHTPIKTLPVNTPSLDPKNNFEEVYLHYYSRVLRFVRKHITRDDLAEELTQDIFLKLYQHKDSYSHQFEIAVWIWGISRNTLYDYLRKVRSSLWRLCSLDDLFVSHQFEPYLESHAESLLIEHNEASSIQKAITHLPQRQREILTLRVMDGFSYEEISEKMNLSLSAVKSLLHRTRQTLIRLMQQEVMET